MAGAVNISRAADPQNFLDSMVTTRLRLPTPLPQFLFAQMVMGQRIFSSGIAMGYASATEWAIMMGGGGQLAPELDRLVRFADLFPGIILARDEFGLGRGDTIKMDRDIYSGGGYTVAARERVTGKRTATTGQRINEEEVAVTLKHIRGPFASGGTEPQPYVIEEFEAKYRANREALASKVFRHLHYDRVKYLDTVVRDEFLRSSYITFPDGIADVGDFTPGGGQFITLDQMQAAKDAISGREWRPFPNGDYLTLVPNGWQRQMTQDPNYVKLAKNHAEDRNPIFSFVSRIDNTVNGECTTLKTYVAGDLVDGVAVPAGVELYEAILMGPSGVAFGIGQDVQARVSDDTDFQAQTAVIWDAKEGHKLVDERAIQRVIFQKT